jgi:protein SCO1/2
MQAGRLVLIIAALVVSLAAGAATFVALRQSGGAPSGAVPIGGDFTLTSHTGQRVHDADFRGRLMLVYFGYTFCPDVCPSELQVISDALDRLGPDADEVAPLFITVDPERDTQQVLADYIPFFHQRLVGLTGTPDEIATAAKAYRIYYASAGSGEEGGAYLMDHTSLVYLMGRDGGYLRHFTAGTAAEEMAAAIRQSL